MMTFEEFAKELKSRMEAQLGAGYTVLFSQILKNNSVIQPQLTIQKAGSPCGPGINLQEQYKWYIERQDISCLDWIAEKVIRLYGRQNVVIEEAEKQAERLYDYGFVEERILFKLVNTKDNQELLAQIPHIPYLDLSIVFYVSLTESESQSMTVLIYNQHMELWNVTTDDLYQAAKRNTPEKMPVRFCSMVELFFGFDEAFEEEWEKDMLQVQECDKAMSLYVLTNTLGIHGASTILYPGILKKCADTLGTDMIILPSSTHEVLLLPYKEDVDAENIAFMIKSINHENVPREDWLSDHAYLYRREEDTVTAI